MLSSPLRLAQDGSQEVLCTGKASHPDDHWPPIGIGSQLECQEGATKRGDMSRESCMTVLDKYSDQYEQLFRAGRVS